jgi:trypsin-like peptidase
VSLRIRFQGGPNAGQVLTFGDEVEWIAFGRNPEKCQVVFLPEETQVAREHCALRRVLGAYRLVLKGGGRVQVDGRPGFDDQELAPVADLQLGLSGPRLVLETLDASGLPRTAYQGPRQARARTLLARLGSTTRAARLIGLASLALVALLAALGLGGYLRLSEDVRLTQSGILSLTERQREVIGDLGKLRRETSGRMSDALAQAKGSVYLLLAKNAEGRVVETWATAWVVDQGRGILATNAHVVDGFETLSKDGKQLFARSNSVPVRDYAVREVLPHPGYAAFRRLVTEYLPLTSTGRVESQFAGACDVALVTLEAADGLAPALPLAPQAKLASLRAGDPVGFVGYPMEDLPADGVNVAQPEPTTQLGHVTAVTDFFFARSLAGDGQLVQNSLPGTGGASGSPILDADGQVVAIFNAANFAQASNPTSSDGITRIPSAVLVNYGQRADLIRELLEGRAATTQDARTQEWSTDIQRFRSGRHDPEETLGRLVERWRSAIRPLEPKRLRAQKASLPAEATPEGRHVARFDLDVTTPGHYLLSAIATSEQADINLYLFDKDGDSPLAGDEAQDSFPTLPVDVGLADPEALSSTVVPMGPKGQANLVLMVVGPEGGAEFTLYVIQAVKP